MILRDYQSRLVSRAGKALDTFGNTLAVGATGGGKCLGKGTPVMMFDGTIKPVEEVQKDELLMGPDSNPRRVVSLAHGYEELFKVVPTKGDSFVVNKSHILSFKISGNKPVSGYKNGSIVNVDIEQYLGSTSHFRHCAKAWRVGVDFQLRDKVSLTIPPYILGVWLGDGSNVHVSAFAMPDHEILTEVEEYAHAIGLSVRHEHSAGKCPMAYISNIGEYGKKNPFSRAIRALSVNGNKHVPFVYKTASREDRLEILAGLLDTDGHSTHGGYDFISKDRKLADDVVFISRSLGLAAYVKPSMKKSQTMAEEKIYYRVSISGDCSIVPCRVARKKSHPRQQKKDVLRTGITIETIGVGEYFGFELEGPDRLFLLGDFTVTHNTVCLSALVRAVDPGKALVLQHRDELVSQNAKKFKLVNPDWRIGFFDSTTKSWAGRCTFGMVQTLHRNVETMPSLDLIVIDECFPSGTLVDGMRIESIKVGDVVRSFNHTIGRVEFKPVVSTFKNTPSSMCSVHLGNGSIIKCTTSHPVYVYGKGYVEASSLKENDYVCRSTKFDSVFLVRSSDRKSNQESKSGIQQSWTSLLLKRMFGFLLPENKLGNNGSYKQEVCIEPDEIEQSNEKFGIKGENVRNAQKDRTQANCCWRERARGNCSASGNDESVIGLKPERRTCDTNKNKKRSWISNLLQGGYWHFILQSCRRAGREHPLREGSGEGQKERLPFDFIRVDGVEVHKQTSDGKFGGLCPDGYVYNIEVEGNNNYFVDGVLVHNCHHAISSTYQKIIARAKDINPDVMIAGFTATPARGDGKGMRSVFSNVCDMVTIDELVAAGFLVEPKCYVMTLAGVEDALKDVRRDKSGEYDMHEVEEVMNTTAHNKSVVREWKNIAGDRKTIIFCSTVEHSKSVCQEFERSGVNVAHIDGTMPRGARKATLNAFDHGPIQVLCNCGVLTEGFDSQPVGCVVLLRPCSYKSTMLQMIGRGLRTVDPEIYPGIVKRDCVVLDFGASIKTHGDLSTQIRMDDREKMKQKCPECQGEIPMNVKECPLCGAVLREDSEGGRKEREIVDGKLVEFQLLKKSPFRWIDLFGTSKVMMASGFNAWVSVVSPDGETWTAIGKLKGENVKKLAVAGRTQAIARADDFLRTFEESDAAKKSKRWMNDPATDNQWRHLERFQYARDSLGISMNKYQAACHMNFQFNRRAIEGTIL